MSDERNASSNSTDDLSVAADTRPYGRVIDAHMHWYPQAFVDLMIKKGTTHGAVTVSYTHLTLPTILLV